MRARGLAFTLLVVAGCAAAPPPAPPPPVARLAARSPDARCSACTLPVLDGGREWPDGRVVCRTCHADAVVDPAEAAGLLAAARADLRERFGVRLDDHTRLELALVDQPTLLAHAHELAHPALQAFSTIGPGGASIEALYGLPRAPLRAILVHELFHAHQAARRASGAATDPAFVEGAAQWVQLRVLEELGAHAWAARLLANEDPIYGRGLRRFRRLVQVEGEARALERGAVDGRFPPGY